MSNYDEQAKLREFIKGVPDGMVAELTGTYPKAPRGPSRIFEADCTDKEQTAVASAIAARDAVRKAIADYCAAGFGSHVTGPLSDALVEIDYSISEVRQ